jgi:putative hemolysin
VFSPLLLFLGEIVPKSVYQQKAELGTPVIVFPHRAAFFLFPPIIFFFSQIAHLPIRIAGGSKAAQSVILTREQLRAVL